MSGRLIAQYGGLSERMLRKYEESCRKIGNEKALYAWYILLFVVFFLKKKTRFC